MPRRPKAADALSTALASGAMARLVRYFAVNPEIRPHVRALQRATRLTPAALQTELDRFVTLGVLDRRPDGGRVRYALREAAPAWPPLRELARALSTPADVLPYALAEVPGVDAAFVYGSHAQGTARPDSDVDVLLLGRHIDGTALYRHTLDAAALLDREVNVVHVTPAELAVRVAAPGFWRRVLAGAKQWVVGSPAELDEALLSAGSAA